MTDREVLDQVAKDLGVLITPNNGGHSVYGDTWELWVDYSAHAHLFYPRGDGWTAKSIPIWKTTAAQDLRIAFALAPVLRYYD